MSPAHPHCKYHEILHRELVNPLACLLHTIVHLADLRTIANTRCTFTTGFATNDARNCAGPRSGREVGMLLRECL